MTGFDVLANFNHNPEQLLSRTRLKINPTETNSASNPSETSEAPVPPMAEKTIREFSTPSDNNVPVGPAVNRGENFELKPGVIHMV
jgi:hypothetical protein